MDAPLNSAKQINNKKAYQSKGGFVFWDGPTGVVGLMPSIAWDSFIFRVRAKQFFFFILLSKMWPSKSQNLILTKKMKLT